MPDKERYLIVTADEQTWKFDRPVIFLGEWCRLYDRKHIWQEMDAILASPYGLEKSQKDDDYAAVLSLERKLLPPLCGILNEYHQKAYSQRFWKIMLGHWLRRYITVIINRVKTLEACFKHYTISGIAIYPRNDYVLATSDSNTAIWAFNDDHWNNVLTAYLLDFFNIKDLSIDLLESPPNKRCFSFDRKTINHLPFLKKYIFPVYQKVTKVIERYVVHRPSAFIIRSYLPGKEVVKLQLALGQYPQLWPSPRPILSKEANNLLREELTKKLKEDSVDRVENITRSLLFYLLPICFLEGFKALDQLAEGVSWPKKPKFIFTSNSFDTNEVFKLWAAKKIEKGTTYIVGQHGNNYGTYCYMDPSIEEQTADKFLTWGWTDGLGQHKPAFIFKTANKKPGCYNPKGGVLLVEQLENFRMYTWDSTAAYKHYFTDQQCFVGDLSPHIKRQLTIRLATSSQYRNWGEVPRWKAFDPSLRIETGRANISNLISQSRLVVHSYDSTGILETLSQNIPTLAFWQNGFEHLRESAKPYYQLLVDVGIVHLSADSAARKVNQIWDDVDGWWMQDEVQDAKKQFCERYARTSKNPIAELKKILLI